MPPTHTHTRTYARTYTQRDPTGGRYTAVVREIERRFFPRSFVLLCFDSGDELWFRATTSGRLLLSRASITNTEREREKEGERETKRLILSTLEFASRIREHLTHHLLSIVILYLPFGFFDFFLVAR